LSVSDGIYSKDAIDLQAGSRRMTIRHRNARSNSCHRREPLAHSRHQLSQNRTVKPTPHSSPSQTWRRSKSTHRASAVFWRD